MTPAIENFVSTMNHLGKERIPFLFVVDFAMENPLVLSLEEAAGNGIYYAMRGKSNFTGSVTCAEPLRFSAHPVGFPEYKSAFDKAINQIHLGNTFLLNLTFSTEIKVNRSLLQIFGQSRAPYRLLFREDFVVFSPECFVKIANGRISSFPMKGTIDAALPEAAAVILNDEKEMAEHATIVDLIRNDLSMVADHVRVETYRYLEEVVTHHKTLIQVSSEITGDLPDDWQDRMGTILTTLLPAGSICGAPKPSTLRIIRETETHDRGYYTGVFGIFDGESLDSAVMIRFIQQENGRLWYKSGGGITHLSDAESEYREMVDKVYVAL